jgi:hypothetical protein
MYLVSSTFSLATHHELCISSSLYRRIALHTLRLSALVNLQTHPRKGIFSPSHLSFPVQFQIFCTRQPLCLKLQTNYQMRAPRVILFSSPSLHSLSLLPNSPPTPASISASPRRRRAPSGGETRAAAVTGRSRELAPPLPPELAASSHGRPSPRA